MPSTAHMGQGLKKLGNKNMQEYCFYGSVKLTSHGAQEASVIVPYARIWGAQDGHWTGEIKLTEHVPDDLKDILGGTVTVQTGDLVSGKATATLDLIDSVWTVHLKGLKTSA